MRLWGEANAHPFTKDARPLRAPLAGLARE